ncbi:Uncharacterised protein [uncultured archaeon]|nr:Uncharacterised protein [uncultured archaeon]
MFSMNLKIFFFLSFLGLFINAFSLGTFETYLQVDGKANFGSSSGFSFSDQIIWNYSCNGFSESTISGSNAPKVYVCNAYSNPINVKDFMGLYSLPLTIQEENNFYASNQIFKIDHASLSVISDANFSKIFIKNYDDLRQVNAKYGSVTLLSDDNPVNSFSAYIKNHKKFTGTLDAVDFSIDKEKLGVDPDYLIATDREGNNYGFLIDVDVNGKTVLGSMTGIDATSIIVNPLTGLPEAIGKNPNIAEFNRRVNDWNVHVNNESKIISFNNDLSNFYFMLKGKTNNALKFYPITFRVLGNGADEKKLSTDLQFNIEFVIKKV